MTYDEILAFVKLQLDEENPAYWTDANMRTYLVQGASQFLSRSGLGTVKQTITLDTARVRETETKHVQTVQFVPDSPGGGNSITGQSFILYDTEGLAYTFIFSNTGAVTTDAMIALRRYYITFAPGATASAIASAAYSVMTSIANSPWSVSISLDTLSIAWTLYGYTVGAANVDVSNGVDTFAMTVVTQGYDDGYFFDYPFAREKSVIYTDADGLDHKLTRFGWEDYRLLTLDERQIGEVCHIDAFKGKIIVPYTAGTIIVHFYPTASSDTLDNVLKYVIPEDFHLAIAKFALYLATQKDKNITISATYYGEFKSECNRALEMAATREVSNYSEGWSLDNHNPHKEQNLPSLAGQFGSFRTGG
jgi:hypothetical protein